MGSGIDHIDIRSRGGVNSLCLTVVTAKCLRIRFTVNIVPAALRYFSLDRRYLIGTLSRLLQFAFYRSAFLGRYFIHRDIVYATVYRLAIASRRVAVMTNRYFPE